MTKWVKAGIFDKCGKWNYVEELGRCCRYVEFLFYPVDDKGISWEYVYIKDGSSYSQTGVLRIAEKILNCEPIYKYTRKYEKIKISHFKLEIRFSMINSYSTQKHYEEVSLEDLKNYTYYKTDEDFKYERPIYSNIKVGDEFLYEGIGVCKVTKLYDYPNTESFCEVETKDNKKINIQWYDEKFYNLPYKDNFNERDELMAKKYDYAFEPAICKESDILNVMWQPINDAAGYIVKLYKYLDRDAYKKIYHLQDYNVNRNTCFLSVSGLVGKGYYVVIIAENRNGEQIASSQVLSV